MEELAIDTDQINKQFDIGGEHGTKKDIKKEFNNELEMIY